MLFSWRYGKQTSMRKTFYFISFYCYYFFKFYDVYEQMISFTEEQNKAWVKGCEKSSQMGKEPYSIAGN